MSDEGYSTEPERLLQVLRARGVVMDQSEELGVYGRDEQDGEEEEVKLEFMPARIRCTHCGCRVITVTTDENSATTYLFAFLIFYMLGLYALILLPVVWPILKDVYHHCPNCLSVIGVKSNVGCPNPRSQVMTFKFGSCICVLMRKYVLLIAALAGGVSTYYHWNFAAQTAQVERGPAISEQWSDFFLDCGLRAYEANPVHATQAFETRYKDRTVTWKGEVVSYRAPLNLLIYRREAALLLQMRPSSHIRTSLGTDLVLAIAPGAEPASTEKGVVVEFDGTLTNLGRRDWPTKIRAWRVSKLNILPAALEKDAVGVPVNRTGNGRWHHHQEYTRDADIQHVIEGVFNLAKGLPVEPSAPKKHRGPQAIGDAPDSIAGKLKDAVERIHTLHSHPGSKPLVTETGAENVAAGVENKQKNLAPSDEPDAPAVSIGNAESQSTEESTLSKADADSATTDLTATKGAATGDPATESVSEVAGKSAVKLAAESAGDSVGKRIAEPGV
jgi:hypothetical protein